MKKDILNDDTGRSMVEMLGTLAIIGVLSVGGVAGYNSAMNRMKANEVIDEANKRALVVAMSIAAGGGQEKESVSLAEFKNNEIAGAKFDTVATMQDGLYQIKITNLPRKVYALVKASLGAKSGVKISEPCEPAGDSCSAFFYFDENLRSDPQATNGGSSAADSASQTAAPNYYCDPINNNQVCREDKPADCERCNGTCDVNAYGPLADICQPFKYTCNDTGITKDVGSGGASSGYPCACAEDSGYFYNDEQARAALCNSTALKEYYCAGNTIKPVTKSGEPEGSWEACLRPTSCLNGNRGYYANLQAAVDAMCAASAVPDVPDGAYYCYADGKTVGNNNIQTGMCNTGYVCVPYEVSNYDTLYDARTDLCKSATIYECGSGGGYIVNNKNGDRYDCPSGASCTPGSSDYYLNYQSALDAMCSVGSGTPEPALNTGYFECKENGTKICQVDTGHRSGERLPGERLRVDTCSACPTGYGCGNGTGYYNSLRAAVNAMCTGGADDGGYYCYRDGKTVGNGSYTVSCDTYNYDACIPGERSQYNELRPAKNELCYLHRYQCAPNGEYIAYGNVAYGSPNYCPSGTKCSPYEESWYANSILAVNGMCTSGGGSGVPDSVASGPLFSCQGSSVCKSCSPSSPTCETCSRCPSGYDCGEFTKNGYYHDYQEAAEALCTGGLPPAVRPVRYYCDASGQNVVAPGGSQEACPDGYWCPPNDTGNYVDYAAAKAGLCINDLRTYYYCASNGHDIINSSNNSPEATCGTNYECSPGSKGKYLNGDAASDGLCYREGAPGTESLAGSPATASPTTFYCYADGKSVGNGNYSNTCDTGFACVAGRVSSYNNLYDASNDLCARSGRLPVSGAPAVPTIEAQLPESVAAGGSSVANTTVYDCRNNNTVCLSGYEECNTCSRGEGCLKGVSGFYSDLDEAVEGICTGSVNQAKADQTPITNDLPWWV